MTPRLGNSFSKNSKTDFVARHCKPGAVFRMHVADTTPPKSKRFVILAFDREEATAAILYINTNMPSSPYLRSFQHLLRVKDCTFLDRDSYLDCSKIYENQISWIKEQCISDTETYLGEMCGADMDAVIKIVRSATTISVKVKKTFGLF